MMKRNSLNIGETPSEEYFTKQLKQWLFLYSDEVFIDGEPISKADRAMIAASGFNMRPEPKSIEVSETSQGRKMEEAEFIEYEKQRIGNISVGAGEISIKREYLAFLNQRAKAKPKPEQKDPKLSLKQIALIHAFEGWTITEANKDEIAVEKYGLKNGHKLLQDFRKFKHSKDRLGEFNALSTPLTVKNMINLFEGVLEHLSEKAKEQALKEITTMKQKAGID